jgi:hypothetical protein
MLMKELYEYSSEQRKKIIEKLNNNSKFRYIYFEKNFYSFALWYFSFFFNSKSSDFHKNWAKNMFNNKDCFIV